jgi:transposase
MEASGYARWFERLVVELQFEFWIGDAAEIRTKRVRKQETDRQDAQLILRLLLEDRWTVRRLTWNLPPSFHIWRLEQANGHTMRGLERN